MNSVADHRCQYAHGDPGQPSGHPDQRPRRSGRRSSRVQSPGNAAACCLTAAVTVSVPPALSRLLVCSASCLHAVSMLCVGCCSPRTRTGLQSPSRRASNAKSLGELLAPLSNLALQRTPPVPSTSLMCPSSVRCPSCALGGSHARPDVNYNLCPAMSAPGMQGSASHTRST